MQIIECKVTKIFFILDEYSKKFNEIVKKVLSMTVNCIVTKPIEWANADTDYVLIAYTELMLNPKGIDSCKRNQSCFFVWISKIVYRKQ